MRIRPARPEDSAALLRIYAQYIHSPVTFEYALPTEPEFAARIGRISETYPYLVCEENGGISGYAYAHRQAEREAYQWNAELSVYLDAAAASRGRGTRLYRMLLDILLLQGVRSAYALVTLPNAASERLHASLGFRTMGVQSEAGFKAGAWHDVAWFVKDIAPHDAAPRPLLPVSRLDADVLRRILDTRGRVM